MDRATAMILVWCDPDAALTSFSWVSEMMGVTVNAGARRLGVPPLGYDGSRRSWGPTNKMGYILVVDDDESICDLIDLALTDEGYEVVCARNGGDALRLLQERAPALVLFNLVMPDQGGADFINACRQVPNGAAPMIVVSGFPNLDQIAAQIGADGLVAKPFELTDLLATVQAALAAREIT
jgi:CheY-like chemotaxis protein